MAVRDAANYNCRLADIRRNFSSSSVDLQTNVRGGGQRAGGRGEGQRAGGRGEGQRAGGRGREQEEGGRGRVQEKDKRRSGQ